MKILYLTESIDRFRAQQHGAPCRLLDAGPLRADISTDEITPVAILSHYDERLAQYAHTGLTLEGHTPISKGWLCTSGVQVLVAGARYGKGSSREHSPVAELWAGIRIIFARSFERIYRQNADNIGLITSTNFALLEQLEQGQEVSLEALIANRDPFAKKLLRAGGLLAFSQRVTATNSSISAAQVQARAQSHAPQTFFEKIVNRHLVQLPEPDEGLAPENPVFVRADWRFIHEYYTGMAAHMLTKKCGNSLRIDDAKSVIVFEDHTSYIDESPVHRTLGLVPNVLAMQRAQRDFVQQHQLRFHQTQTEQEFLASPSKNLAGISHAVMAEHYVLPGQLVVGTDSHTPHSGALGCVAFGVGTTDMANALVTGTVRLTVPSSIKVDLRGQLPLGVTAKDIVLHLLAQPFIASGQGIGKVFEFVGEVVDDLSIDERATLTNMAAELGGLTGIIAPDKKTVEFLQERRGVRFDIEPWMRSDDMAKYEATIEIECHKLEPMIALPGDPSRGQLVSSLESPVRIDIAYAGSCTAGKREDFYYYFQVLAWGFEQGLSIPAHVQLFLQYGTTAVRDYCQSRGYERVFKAVGARILQPTCGACANCGPGSSTSKEQVTISAINRNFAGRSGPGQVWLASPPTVVASALAGYICSFEQLKART